jgi:hypothetical protein
MQIHRYAAAFLLAVIAAPALPAQTQMLFGDLQIFGQDFLASSDPALAGAVGMSAGSQLMTGQAQLDLNERLSFDRGQLFVADSAYWWQGTDGGTLQNDLLQAYVSVTPVPILTFVLGKQRVSWGTGYAFFPGDRINPPVNPHNRSEGFYGLSASLAPSASLSITASVRMDTAFAGIAQLPGLSYPTAPNLAASLPFLAPYLPSTSSPWLGLRYAVYAEAFLGDLDLHAGTTWQWQRVLRPTVDFSLDVLGFILDGALAVELCNSDLYPQPDGSYASPGFGDAFPIASVGLQRSASSDAASVTGTIEYLYDGTGYDASQSSRFLGDFLSALSTAQGSGSQSGALLGSVAGSAWFSSGELIPSLGRHYAALSINASVNQLFSADSAVVINLQDLSLALQAELRLTRLEAIDVFVRAITAWGPDSSTEFGSSPVRLAAGAGMIVHF